MVSRLKIFVIAAIVLLALCSNLRLIKEEIGQLHQHDQTLEESRIREVGKLRAMLPQSGVVGYVTDQRPEDIATVRDFYLAQYALCPLVLVRDATVSYVIANCSQSGHGNCFGNSGFVLLKELDGGIRLYRQRQQ